MFLGKPNIFYIKIARKTFWGQTLQLISDEAKKHYGVKTLVQTYKRFIFPSMMNRLDKLERLFCSWQALPAKVPSKDRAYLSGAPLLKGRLLDLPTNIILARCKHSSLFCLLVSEEKKVL
jgi:hypothetical protein